MPDLVLAAEPTRLWLHKPAGLPVFPPHADPAGDCVLARLLARFPERAAAGWPEGFAGGIAHRLDTATSGLLLVARTPADLPGLRALFRDGALRKHYRFRSSGAGRGGVVDVPIAHHPRRADRMVVRRGPRTAHRGKWYPAWTRLEHLGEDRWAAEIRTGVMHQVRVHAAYAGAPLDGDALYGGAPGVFRLHHLRVDGPGWSSPEAPLPPDAPLPPETVVGLTGPS